MRKKLVIYISGPMSNRNNFNFYNFFRKEKKLLEEGYEVINPAFLALELSEQKEKKLNEISYDEYITLDMEKLKEANTIYMLSGWENSGGAKKELEYAQKNKYNIIFEDDDELINNIISTPDSEILKEAEEDFGDPNNVVDKFKSILKGAK